MSADLSAHIKREVAMNGFMNAIFNGGIAWWLLKDGAPLTLGGSTGMGVDMAATGAILLFIVSLIVIPLNRGKVNKGTLSPIQWNNTDKLHGVLQRLPQSLFLRALCFALVGLVVLAPLTFSLLSILGVEQMSPMQYSIFKGLWAGFIAGLMTGPMIMLGAAPQQANT